MTYSEQIDQVARLADRGALPSVVQSVHLVKGRPYVETIAADLREGRSVPVLVQGGGLDRFSYCGPTPHDGAEYENNPDLSGASQAVVVPRESSATTYAVGAVAHVKSQFTELAPEPGADDDHEGTVSILDNVMCNAGSKVILDHRGQVALVVKQDLRVQLEPGGFLRISRNGAAAGRIPLAGPLVVYIRQLESQVRRLETWAKTLTVATPTGGTGSPVVPFTGVTPSVNADELTAAAVKISADSLATPPAE